MGSHGIKDRVAIVGMACTHFGELFDKGIDDLLIESALGATESAGIGIHDVEAFWLGTRQSGIGGDALSVPLKLDMPPVTRVENRCATVCRPPEPIPTSPGQASSPFSCRRMPNAMGSMKSW